MKPYMANAMSRLRSFKTAFQRGKSGGRTICFRQDAPFLNVFRREIGRMLSRRIYFAACVALPLFSIVFMATIFGNGQMENLPVGIVDMDGSALSRRIGRMVEAVPTLRVTDRYVDPAEARAATERKEIYGYLVIPVGFDAKLQDGKTATLTYYFHYALLSVGEEIRGAFEHLLRTEAVSPVVEQAVALGVEPSQIETFLLPVSSQDHPLFNPDMDYSIYLTYPFCFVLLQVLLLLVTTYALGSESKFHTADEWIEAAGGNMLVAVTAKLLPYTLIFILLSCAADCLFFGVMHIPFSCGFLPLNAIACLFVVATQALAVFIYSLFPAVSLIISVVSMVGSLGATLSGVTFPVPFMYRPVYCLSFLFPVRHFVELGQTLLYGDYGFAYMWQGIAALLLFLLPAIGMLPRLKKAVLSHKYENIE